ncbi:WhiB family transcriptional regulator [Mycobacterium sp. CnD-18-1]|uniref:WhiB family transcriptional regulator n=1 Tax=Mycobacterium sp. CnD-18-1 TaxID=2917744 RepID=UPI001EF238FF|nr:WhiB family transcriptional regulator [Mycobacterium sp. CnD-18-1]MCG7610378.1 WhiB family transcriptional regulator [Mycobacterium sp. CnD-18-1]
MTDYWQGRAACADHNPSRWDTDEPAPETIQICNGCPVRQQCLQDALDRKESRGIRGGLTPNQRHQLARRIPPRSCKGCDATFMPGHHLVRYCTPECRRAAQTEQQRGYEARHREKRRQRDKLRPESRHLARRSA